MIGDQISIRPKAHDDWADGEEGEPIERRYVDELMTTQTDEQSMTLADDNLKDALAGLPLRLCRAFELQAAGHSAEEIGRQLHVSRSTAWRLVSQARQRLLSKLKAGARAGRR